MRLTNVDHNFKEWYTRRGMIHLRQWEACHATGGTSNHKHGVLAKGHSFWIVDLQFGCQNGNVHHSFFGYILLYDSTMLPGLHHLFCGPFILEKYMLHSCFPSYFFIISYLLCKQIWMTHGTRMIPTIPWSLLRGLRRNRKGQGPPGRTQRCWYETAELRRNLPSGYD